MDFYRRLLHRRGVTRPYPAHLLDNLAIMNGFRGHHSLHRGMALRCRDFTNKLRRDDSLEHLTVNEGPQDYYFCIAEAIAVRFPNLQSLDLSDPRGSLMLNSDVSISKLLPHLRFFSLRSHLLEPTTVMNIGALHLGTLDIRAGTCYGMEVSQVKHMILIGQRHNVSISSQNIAESICTSFEFWSPETLFPRLTHFYLSDYPAEVSINWYLDQGVFDSQGFIDRAPNLKVLGLYGRHPVIKSARLEWCSLRYPEDITIECSRLHTLEIAGTPHIWRVDLPRLVTLRVIILPDHPLYEIVTWVEFFVNRYKPRHVVLVDETESESHDHLLDSFGHLGAIMGAPMRPF